MAKSGGFSLSVKMILTTTLLIVVTVVGSGVLNVINVRKAFQYAINRDEMTSTVLKDLAIPGKSLLPPGYPGYNEHITSQAVFDPAKANAAWPYNKAGATPALWRPIAAMVQAPAISVLDGW